MTERSETTELKPCPHCPDGGEPDATAWAGEQDGKPISGPGCNKCGSYSDTVEIWNRRSDDAELGVLGEVREFLRGDRADLIEDFVERHIGMRYLDGVEKLAYCILMGLDGFETAAQIRAAIEAATKERDDESA